MSQSEPDTGVITPGEPAPPAIRQPLPGAPLQPAPPDQVYVPIGGTATTTPLAPAPPAVEPPQTPEALPGMSDLAKLIVLLGIIALAAVIGDAIRNALRFLLGPLLKRTPMRNLTPAQWQQTFSSSLGSAFGDIDATLGHSFGLLAENVTGVGAAILAAERTLHTAAVRIGSLSGIVRAQQTSGGHTARQARAASEAASAAQSAVAAEARRAAAAESVLRERIAAEPSYVHRLLEPELDAMRSQIGELQKGATVTWDELTRHSDLLGETAMVAAVAAGLGRLGGGWIRCEANQLLGNRLCEEGPESMGNVLGLLFGAAILLDLREYTKLVQSVAKPAAAGVKAILKA